MFENGRLMELNGYNVMCMFKRIKKWQRNLMCCRIHLIVREANRRGHFCLNGANIHS